VIYRILKHIGFCTSQCRSILPTNSRDNRWIVDSLTDSTIEGSEDNNGVSFYEICHASVVQYFVLLQPSWRRTLCAAQWLHLNDSMHFQSTFSVAELSRTRNSLESVKNWKERTVNSTWHKQVNECPHKWYRSQILFLRAKAGTAERVLAIAILSVCPLSVCLSHGWISLKRCKLGSPNLQRQLPDKNSQNCSCHNYVKFSPILIIFGSELAKTIELCKMGSFYISPYLCERTTVWNTDASILHNAELLSPVNVATT